MKKLRVLIFVFLMLFFIENVSAEVCSGNATVGTWKSVAYGSCIGCEIMYQPTCTGGYIYSPSTLDGRTIGAGSYLSCGSSVNMVQGSNCNIVNLVSTYYVGSWASLRTSIPNKFRCIQDVYMASGCYDFRFWECSANTPCSSYTSNTTCLAVAGCSWTSSCGDGTCNGAENCTTCPTDCGVCSSPQPCGNGVCDTSENCTTCPTDCGVCSASSVCGGNWSLSNPCSNVYDGNWDTYGIHGLGEANLTLSYIKPVGATRSNTFWHVKTDVGETGIPISESCWNVDPDKIKILIRSYNYTVIGNIEEISWYCLGETNNGVYMGSLNSAINSSFPAYLFEGKLYEAEMLWTVSCGDGFCSSSENCTTCPSDCGICPVEGVCGDGAFDEGEQCDDGNLVNGDGCNSSCFYEQGAYWADVSGVKIPDRGMVNLGDTVKLVLNQGSILVEGSQYNFSVYEYNLARDNVIFEGANSLVGTVDEYGNLVAVWKIYEENISIANDWNEFYFKVESLGGVESDYLSVNDSDSSRIHEAVDSPLSIQFLEPSCGDYFMVNTLGTIRINVSDDDDVVGGNVSVFKGNQLLGVALANLTNGINSFSYNFSVSGNIRLTVFASSSEGVRAADLSLMIIDPANERNYAAACIEYPRDLDRLPSGKVYFNASTSKAKKYTPGVGLEDLPFENVRYNWTFSGGYTHNPINALDNESHYFYIFFNERSQTASLSIQPSDTPYV